MFKDIKLTRKLTGTIVILLGLFTHLGHCSTFDASDKEDQKLTSPSSVAFPLTPFRVEPTTTLALAFESLPSHIRYYDIRSIVVSCSNGQILETNGWASGKCLPFFKFRTKESIALQIKATDCPVTLTIRCLSTFLRYSVMRKHLPDLMTVPFEDYLLWGENSPVSFTLDFPDLFWEDGSPKGSDLYFQSSSPDLKDVSCEME